MMEPKIGFAFLSWKLSRELARMVVLAFLFRLWTPESPSPPSLHPHTAWAMAEIGSVQVGMPSRRNHGQTGQGTKTRWCFGEPSQETLFDCRG